MLVARCVNPVFPINSVGNIRAPLLMAYHRFNSDRPLVIYQDYVQLEAALSKQRKVFKNVFIDDNPGYNPAENWFGFYREVEAFFAQHLAGPSPASVSAKEAAKRVN